uniref:Retrotransposon gag domain-containing protein n=1 Tax=Nicotiana tabacum TaxID=4097 RepID=A0A1S4BT18_TOBAC|nr:PREDICTED: uncharacterized protein LOC107811583 [Nicotiana tabacum]
MSLEIPLPTILVSEESSISAIPTSESTTAEENRILWLRMLEMLDDWNNGKEPPSVIPGFPEMFSRTTSEWYMDQDISRWHIWDDLARDFVRQFQYNIDIAPDRNSLSNLKKKPSESFREYAIKWHEQASRGGSGGIAKGKKREETFMASSGKRISYTPGPLFSERTPQHYYPHQDLAYTPQPYSVMNTQPYVRPPQQANRSQAPPPRNQPPYRNHYNPQLPQNNFRPQEPPRRQTFIPIGEPYSTLFPKLVQMGFLQLVPQTRHNPASPAYKAGVRCAYHSGAEGHDTNDCWTLRRVVENLIEQGKIVLRDEEVPNVTNNPLLAHDNGSLIGMICEDNAERNPKAAPKHDKGEKKTNTVKTELEKKAETKIEKMVPSMNEVLYIPRGRSEKPQRFEIKKGNTDKPMTDPSTVPWNYQQTLVTYKGKEITGELPENTSAGKYSYIQEVNNATRKRFPPKKPVSAKEAETFFQKMNMLDFEVVDQLRKYPEQVSMLSLLMRSAEHQKILLKTLNEAYVPTETSVEQLERMTERFFAVNKVSFSNNDLPPEGAPHNKALHLTVKCEDYYVKRGHPRRNRPDIDYRAGGVRSNLSGTGYGHILQFSPRKALDSCCRGSREGSEHTVYQAFEVVLAEQYEEGKPCPQPFLSNASIMVAKEMIRQGFKLEEGLGKSLQGITEPITLPSTKKLFGIDFHPTPKYEDWAKKRRNEG